MNEPRHDTTYRDCVWQPDKHDPFDPNTWDLSEPEFRMYAGTLAQYKCVVDEIDYHHFTKWLWVPKRSPCGKIYFRRAVSTYDVFGKRQSAESIYLHREILTRAEGPPPTARRCIVDHMDGDHFNNRRSNLRWATSRENNRNRFGSYVKQRALL